MSAAITIPLEETRTVEEQSVTLTCQVSKAGVKAIWLKDGKEIQSSDNCKIAVDGCTHTLLIQRLALDDEAEYTVKFSDSVSSKATLWVEGKIIYDPFEGNNFMLIILIRNIICECVHKPL